jgi:hypothetical protein
MPGACSHFVTARGKLLLSLLQALLIGLKIAIKIVHQLRLCWHFGNRLGKKKPRSLPSAAVDQSP